MNKSAFARELGDRLELRMSRQMLAKYASRGMPLGSIDSAIDWLADSSVGAPGQRAQELVRRGATRVATSTPSDATLQPDDDDCKLKPDPLLTVADGADFYDEHLASVDIVQLSKILQARLPVLLHHAPATAARLRWAIRNVICTWSASEACPHCRRAVGIIEPPDPGDEPPTRRT